MYGLARKRASTMRCVVTAKLLCATQPITNYATDAPRNCLFSCNRINLDHIPAVYYIIIRRKS